MSSAKKYLIYHRLQLAAHTLKKSADRALMEAANLTTAQSAVLSIVESEEKISQKQVAKYLGLNESAMTAMVSRLTKLGFLTKQRSEEDARAWELTLTEDGQTALKRIRVPFNEINRQIDSMFDDKRQDDFAHMLDRLVVRFEGR
ncbi:MAG: MarR family transcriptional regulator [Proteobacteria bacterium]|jgi:DNA-binding MarR family transcriptional regulator|nr:MarR family transcriptional regulator [Pseudomonadota bacterium]